MDTESSKMTNGRVVFQNPLRADVRNENSFVVFRDALS